MTAKLSNEFDYVAENIIRVREKIQRSAEKSGRKAEDVELMAVTKTMPAQAILAAFENGINLFGENRVQELLEKFPQLDMTGRSAHIIGHLQTNKVKYVIDKVDMIQSLDSLHLAKEIDILAAKAGKVMKVLVEVNIGREPSKSGVLPEELDGFIECLKQYKNILICGIMAIPPVNEDKEKSRPYFAEIRNMFIDIREKKSDNINMNILSMGMSDDFDIAIEEGSTLVRIGTSIFGKRIKMGGK